MDRFWDEFSKSTIVSGLLALMVWGIIGYMSIAGMEIPAPLSVGGGAIIGYFFRVRSEGQTARMRASIIESAAPVPIASTCDCDLID